MNRDVPGDSHDLFPWLMPSADPTIPSTGSDGVLGGGQPDAEAPQYIASPLTPTELLPGYRPSIPGTEHQPAPKKHKRRRWPRRIFMAVVAVVVINALLVIPYIWVTFPRTAFMLQGGGPAAYQYVSLQHVSRYAIASAIAQEDQQLGMRDGAFTFSDFKDRAQAYVDGEKDPTGSTIHQQLVKNIYLWPGQDPVRKGLEAVLATEYAALMPDQRVMELYLNYAQFGPKL